MSDLDTRKALRRAKRIRDAPPKFTCRACGSQDSRVVDSRGLSSTEAIRRRRQCKDCGARWTTIERVVAVSLPEKKSA